MNYFNFLSSPAAQALGYTILYSLWQAFIVFICLRLILKCIPHASSRLKYILSYIAHLSIVAWFIITLLHQLPLQQDEFIYAQIIQPGALHQHIFDHSTSTIYNGLSFSFLNSYLPWIAAFYFGGIAWFSLRLVFSYFQTVRLRLKGLSDVDKAWQAYIRNLCYRMGIRKPVYTYISRFIETPVMLGFFKPMILLPLAAINNLPPQQIEAILLHELAHIRRNDYLLNLIQSVIDTILFFNPFSWWISKNIRHEREKSCDEMVLQLSEPYHYARALLALEEFGQSNHRLVMAATSKHPQLLHRIKNIMETKNKPTRLRHKLAALAIVIAATISVAWFSPKENKQPDPEKASVLSKTITAISPYSYNTNSIINATDTSAPGVIAPLPPVPPIPPAMLAVAEPPIPPVPVLPVMPAPPIPPVAPLPPIPPVWDTVPLMDSASAFHFKYADSGHAQELKKYFNGDEWKKQMQDIKKSTAAIQQYLQSKEWKQQLEMIQKNNEKFQKDLLNNEAWKKQMEDIKKNAINLQKEYFSSPEWKKQMEEIKKNTDSLKHYFNSDEWKKQQEEMKHVADSLKTYFNSSEWKEQQKHLQQAMAQTKKYFQSDEWKAQQQKLRKVMDETKEIQKSKSK